MFNILKFFLIVMVVSMLHQNPKLQNAMWIS